MALIPQDKDEAATLATLRASEQLADISKYQSALSKYLQALRLAKNAKA